MALTKAKSTNWKKFDDARPYVSVIGFAFGPDGEFPVIHRSAKVRSAKNAWSIPSGLHEVGFTIAEQFAIECQEELAITVLPESVIHIGVYENISHEDQWHWVLNLVAGYCPNVHDFVNQEPDKHDQAEIYKSVRKFIADKGTFTVGLKEALERNLDKILALQKQLVEIYAD